MVRILKVSYHLSELLIFSRYFMSVGTWPLKLFQDPLKHERKLILAEFRLSSYWMHPHITLIINEKHNSTDGLVWCLFKQKISEECITTLPQENQNLNKESQAIY